MKRLFETVAAAALFCAGGACGWLMRGDGGTDVPPVQPDQAVDSRVAPNGHPARSPDEEVAEPQFAEAISVSFTSKKGDKAKYAVELVWRGDELFAGQVTRTWKEVDPVTKKSANLTAYGTAEVK